jgi:hypothetical protein
LNEEFGSHDVVCFAANATPAESEPGRVPLDLSLVKFVCTLCKKRFEEMANPPSQVDMLVKGGRTSVSLYDKKLFTGHNDSLFHKASSEWQSALSIKPAPLQIKLTRILLPEEILMNSYILNTKIDTVLMLLNMKAWS